MLRECFDGLDEDDIAGELRNADSNPFRNAVARAVVQSAQPLTALSPSEVAYCTLWWLRSLRLPAEAISLLESIIDDPEIYKLRDHWGLSLLIYAASEKGYNYALECSSADPLMPKTAPFIDRLLAKAMEYDELSSYRTSPMEGYKWNNPLKHFLIGLNRGLANKHIEERRIPGEMARALREWATLVQRQGLDLITYGSSGLEQLKAAKQASTLWSICWCGCIDNGTDGCLELVFWSFSYGARPEDWQLWLTEKTDSFAGEFWDQLQRRDRAAQLALRIE